MPIGLIYNFKDFRTTFLHHFASSHHYQKTSVNLFALKQGPKEALRAYIMHFNQVAMSIPSVSFDMLVNAFTQGLIKGEFFRSLIWKPLKDFDHMLKRATEYIINVEEAQAARRKGALPESAVASERRPPSSHQPPKGPRAGGAQ
ncbi:uncharacterized protein LOC121991275 [Zingiber officinale]|uniref:uncharacterized protein LOC121991275 n=1 Tax=Zingiber officinale TaxID=94328 RepID=UPI001C4C7A95|nr:uncharacterized protein LOC121991275 [Zingiber officinale]